MLAVVLTVLLLLETLPSAAAGLSRAKVERAVAHAHDEAVRPRRHFELTGQALVEHHERVIAADDERI